MVESVDVKAISGFGGKSPACFLVELSGRRFLLDLGEGPEPGKFPDLGGVGPIDAVLISHSHKDHIGALHLLDDLGSPPVYATRMVREITGHPRLDAARDLPLQGTLDILGIEIATGRASHAPGGIWMRLGGGKGVLYSGDWTRESVLYDLDTPPPADLLICDASYGGYDLPLRDSFAQLVVEAAKGPLLLPMPPAGRGLDAAILLYEAGFSIGLCPTHRAIALKQLASGRGEISPCGRQRLGAMLDKSVTLGRDSLPQGVMLAASADAHDGLANALAQRFEDDASVHILFTGFVANGTLGKALIERERAGFIRWNVHPRASDIDWLAGQVRPRAIMPVFAGLSALDDLAKAYPELPLDLSGRLL